MPNEDQFEFIETGEVRPPRTNEWYWGPSGPVLARVDYESGEAFRFPILRRVPRGHDTRTPWDLIVAHASALGCDGHTVRFEGHDRGVFTSPFGDVPVEVVEASLRLLRQHGAKPQGGR